MCKSAQRHRHKNRSRVSTRRRPGRARVLVCPTRLSLEELMLNVVLSRRAVRSARQHLLPPLRLDIAFAESLHAERDASGLQWETGKCMNGAAYGEKTSLTFWAGSLLPLPPRTVPPRLLRHPLRLPANILHHALHSPHRHEIFDQLACGSTSRRQTGLDDRTAECTPRMDRTELEPDPRGEHEGGMQAIFFNFVEGTRLTCKEPSTLG